MPRVELVVSGLERDCPTQHLLKVFEQFGRVESIKGIAATIAHVYYEDSRAADMAIARLNGVTLKGGDQPITVKKSQYQEFLEKRRLDKASGVLDASRLFSRL